MKIVKEFLNKSKSVVTLYKQNQKEIRLKRSTNFIRSLKNKYKGQRCFVIGNGPSLRTEDLERLNNEVTFASHGIFYIFDKTDWRPTFYCAQDAKLISERYSEINKKCKNIKCIFGIADYFTEYPKFKRQDTLVRLLIENFVDDLPKFSEDLTLGAYEGLTVTYFIIQLAAYMGFKEIFLLGVDHFYSGNGNDHFSPKDTCTNIPQTDKTTLSYIKANAYATENNIAIYNATRGGHLEVFERVDFDKIFEEVHL